MSGRGRGRGAYPGNGPFRNLPPWERPGWIGDPANPGTCARYPWLARGWWANPDATVTPPTVGSELLAQQISAAENRLAALKARLAEQKKGSGE